MPRSEAWGLAASELVSLPLLLPDPAECGHRRAGELRGALPRPLAALGRAVYPSRPWSRAHLLEKPVRRLTLCCLLVLRDLWSLTETLPPDPEGMTAGLPRGWVPVSGLQGAACALRGALRVRGEAATGVRPRPAWASLARFGPRSGRCPSAPCDLTSLQREWLGRSPTLEAHVLAWRSPRWPVKVVAAGRRAAAMPRPRDRWDQGHCGSRFRSISCPGGSWALPRRGPPAAGEQAVATDGGVESRSLGRGSCCWEDAVHTALGLGQRQARPVSSDRAAPAVWGQPRRPLVRIC